MRAALVFVAVMVAGAAVLLADGMQPMLHRVSMAITGLAAGVLRACGMAVVQNAQVLGTADGAFRVSVENDCNGAWAHLVLLASILAYPAPLRAKIVGLATAQPVLLALNVVRIVSLFLVGVWAPTLFRAAHVIVWQTLIIGCAVALFLVWAERSVDRPV